MSAGTRRRLVGAALLCSSLVLGTVGCGGGSDEASQGGSTGGDAIPEGLVLGEDLTCQVSDTQLVMRADGQFLVNGAAVGSFTAEGALLNLDGREIGRLHPDGRMTFGGVLQDATIEGARLVGPSGTIAFIDGEGYLNIDGAATPPSPIEGGTPATARTFLFVFAMYACLLDRAMDMQEQ